MAANRLYFGVLKEDYFRELGGISYGELESSITELERRGLIRIEWIGPDDFLVFITRSGADTVNSTL